jgi:16S rRNA (guanine(966)-N(2))-methyltransferase RsmD
MRIVAGKFRSRHLLPLKKLKLRPTSDRLRETLFNVLAGRVENSRVLDLFAGTGAIGIEAISRGSSSVVFADNHSAAAKLIRENLASLEVTAGVRVLVADAVAAIATLAREKTPPFDLVFLDPPYAQESQYRTVLDALATSPLVGADTIVIAEHAKSLQLPAAVSGLRSLRELRQGDSALTFFRRNVHPAESVSRSGRI